MISQDVKEDVDGRPEVNLAAAGTALTSTTVGPKEALDVNIASGSTSGAVPDGTPFVADVDNQTPIGGVFDDTPIADVAAGESGGVRITAKRALHMNLRSAAGVEVGTAGAALRVDPTGATAQPVTDNGGSLTVDAVNLDIRDLSSAQDSVSAVVTSSALPTGAATEASLAAINGKMSPATATLSQVAVANTTTAVLAANAARKGLVIVNDGIAVVKIAFAATTSATAYTYKMQANTTLELLDNRVPTGQISHLGSVANGNLVITEFT